MNQHVEDKVMTANQALIQELCKLPHETEWVEFKHNNYDPEMIGQDISALANSAALHEKNKAYMLWGINDADHEIVGTKHTLQSLKKGNEELENWLRGLLSNSAEFSFETETIDDRKIGILVISRAFGYPVTFEKVEYVRVGSYTKKLSSYPSLQAELWDKIRSIRFEEYPAVENLTLSDTFQMLQVSSYFDLMSQKMPSDSESIAHYLIEDGILSHGDNGLYSITNLGAILFAKDLTAFSSLSRKALRIIQYKDNNRMEMLKEHTFTSGYATGFETALQYMYALLPSQETIPQSGIRTKITAYPEIAIREAVANALIHQDFSVRGSGPMVEIFASRIEITNPGSPLIDTMRILDNPPRSRNEKLASLMRRLHICEEAGTGWDKMVLACEYAQLPAPRMTTYANDTRVTLYSTIKYTDLSLEDRIWACYLHACILFLQGEQMSNASLRERFGLATSSSASISRLIKDTVQQNLIKPADPNTAPRYMRYIPIWA